MGSAVPIWRWRAKCPGKLLPEELQAMEMGFGGVGLMQPFQPCRIEPEQDEQQNGESPKR